MNHKSLSIRKVPPPKCAICNKVASFNVTYTDPDSPVYGPYGKNIRWPNESEWSCEQHVMAVAELIMRKFGLIKHSGEYTENGTDTKAVGNQEAETGDDIRG